MKKVISIILVTGLFLIPACMAQAATSDSVTLKVTISPVISVSITETELLLGSVAAGGTKLSAAAVAVTNDGSGVDETYSLSLTNPADWTASQTAAGIETYLLNAVFDADGASITWDNANHALSTTPVAASATKFSADQTGINVPYNATRKLWFQFKAPTATSVTSEQSIVLTITAQAS